MAFGFFLPRDLKDLWHRPGHHLTAWRRGQDNLIKRMHVEESFRMLDPQPQDEILEVGAAMLYYSGEIAKKCKSLVALDYLPGFGAGLQAWRMPQNLRAVRGDAQTLPFADESFDKVFISEVFPVLPDPLNSTREICRVLRPGGTVTSVHGDIHHRMKDAIESDRGRKLVQEAHEKWGTPTTFEDFRKQFFALHGTSPEFFENRDQVVTSLLEDAGLTVLDTTWGFGPSVQLEYCLLMLEALRDTGVPALGIGQADHLPLFKKLERRDGTLSSGLTIFCKAYKSA